MPSEWNATQNKGTRDHVESTREFPRTTKWQRKGHDVTLTQSCVHAEAKRCTVGSLLDIETRVGNCETRIAKPQDWSA